MDKKLDCKAKRSGVVMKNYGVIKVFTCLTIFTVLVSSCAGSTRMHRLTGVTIPAQEHASIKHEFARVAVLDFQEISHAGSGLHTCPVTDIGFIPGTTSEGAGRTVSNQLRAKLSELGFKVADADSTQKAYEIANKNLGGEYTQMLGLKVARELGVEIIFIGSVMRFEDKIGGKYAADKPASVAFSIAVVREEDGGIIWKAKYEKTQKPLFANLLDFETFMEGGMVWQEAEKLSSIGVKNILKQMPFHARREVK